VAAEYEVNISLNTKKINAQLSTLEKRLSDFSKAADPLGGGTKGAQRSKNLDRIRATGVIINRLGRELNKLEAQGVKVQNERARIKRAVAKLDKGMVETARAHVVETRDFIKEANKGLKIKEKTVKFASVEDKFSYRRLRALARSNQRNEKDLKLNTQMTAQARARMRLLSQSGAKGFVETRPQGRQMSEDVNALTKIQEKRSRLANRINEIEAKGLNVAKLRKQLGKATGEQAARRFGSAEKEFRILEKTLRLEQSKLRILREQRKGFPSSPIRGARTMMGSPAQIAASGRQRVSPIAGRIDIAGSPAQMQAIKQLEMAEIRADKNAHFAELRLIQKRQKIQLDNVDKLFRANERALEKFDRKLQAADKARQKRLAGAPIPGLGGRTYGPSPAFAGPFASPIGGTEGTPGSPAFNRALELGRFRSSPIGGATNIAGSPAARRVRRQRFEQVGLGAGFPLLFGGGAGSVIGGALGGLTGSFGAQIAFSAIGQQIDQFVAGMVDAGKALTSVGSAADFMAEKSLFSSDAMQFRIEKLIEEGKVTEAAALMTQEMAKKVGGTGLKALKDLGTEASKMGKLFSTLILQVQAFISRALTPLLAAINKVVGDVVLNNQFNALMSEATGARAKEIQEFLKPFTRKVRKGAAAKDVVTSEGKRLAVEKFGGQVIPEGAAIEPTQLEVLRAADKPNSEADRAKKLAERQELEAFLALNKQMTAELDRQDEINAMNGKYIAEQLNTADQINDNQEERAGLLQAQINGTEEEFRLNQAIEKIRKKGLLPADEERLINAEKQIFALQEQAVEIERQKQLYEQVGQTIKSGLVDGIMSALDGTKSLGESLSGVLRQLGSLFLNAGIGQLGRSFKIPGFANGGRPPVGRPSIVGERGPELFVPDRAGKIIPNNALGGANVTINVDASGSSVEGNADQASQLGKLLGAAVQQELVKQKRPGGLLAS
jgi:hypothetical protein